MLLEALKIVGVIGAIVLGGRLLLRPCCWIAKSRTPEIFTAASLLLVVGIAYLMVMVGLSMALGAFLAGVLLADSEYRSELEADIEPFKGLLLGLFFIAVGMSIDFGVIMRSPWLMAGILLGFLALGGGDLPWPKWQACLIKSGPCSPCCWRRGRVCLRGLPGRRRGAGVFGRNGLAAHRRGGASMLISPLLLVLVTAPCCAVTPSSNRRTARARDLGAAEAPVIIANFGRYGQIVARVMLARASPPPCWTTAWKFSRSPAPLGTACFMATPPGWTLRIAGAEHARVLVVAVDDPEQSLKIVTLARKHFPQLQLVARARDLTHWNALRDLGVTLVQRELFESSLASARTVLELMGQSPTRAQEMTRRFREHNITLADRMYPHHKDRAKMVAVAEGRAQLAEQMAKAPGTSPSAKPGRRSTQGMAEWRMLEKAANLPTPVIQIK